MKKTILLAASAIVAFSTQAGAANLDHIFANSIKLTAVAGANNVETILKYSADGTIQGASGSAGTWEIKGDQLCSTLTGGGAGGPNGAAQTACSPLAAVENTKIGDTWSFSPSANVNITGELVAGR